MCEVFLSTTLFELCIFSVPPLIAPTTSSAVQPVPSPSNMAHLLEHMDDLLKQHTEQHLPSGANQSEPDVAIGRALSSGFYAVYQKLGDMVQSMEQNVAEVRGRGVTKLNSIDVLMRSLMNLRLRTTFELNELERRGNEHIANLKNKRAAMLRMSGAIDLIQVNGHFTYPELYETTELLDTCCVHCVQLELQTEHWKNTVAASEMKAPQEQ